MAFSDETRDEIFRRAKGRCERCDARLTQGNWHAHHRTSQDAGGSDAPSNGEALCIPCHQATATYGRGSRS
jgi:5-methylcytosine-specific restriction endonuclease McrA